jgi:peptidoglycan hydrolase-like protein with peptidoglycan-binding domain
VREAQTILRQVTAAGDLLPVTGVFDELTVEATKQFQSSNGLKADGIIGKNTWTALLGKKVTTTQRRATPVAPVAKTEPVVSAPKMKTASLPVIGAVAIGTIILGSLFTGK